MPDSTSTPPSDPGGRLGTAGGHERPARETHANAQREATVPTVNPTATMDEPKTAPVPVIDSSENVSDVPTPTADGRPTRTESDSLGSREIPADAYWGIHTSRALENFPIAKRPISVYPDLIVALASVKQAAARANLEIGVLEPHKAELIDHACQLIIDGRFHDQFVVGVMQGWFAAGRWPVTQLKVEAEFAHVSAEQIRSAVLPSLGKGFFATDLEDVRPPFTDPQAGCRIVGQLFWLVRVRCMNPPRD